MTAFADLIPAIRKMADVTFDHEIFARDVDTIIGRFNSQVAVVGAPHEPFTGRTVEQRIRDSRIACVADLLAMLRFRSRSDIAGSDVTIAEVDARLSLLRFPERQCTRRRTGACLGSASEATGFLMNSRRWSRR